MASLWATGVTLLGYFLGNIPFVKENIELMIILIVVLSVLPMVYEYLKHRREQRNSPEEASA